ncbi:class I SAM-dependent methyltransferase [Streptomyces justiciae]|uniref:Class I SAM-dependent methyltransferase n=1 Tax=Streptomyces justiciae TaxID=2780140 RepID=A0ABU3LSD7_9ACTN|nr:class I SAM-dependent methyltransferase [Streptomyces justiciae]MDT7842135.1 class I SAM-dependent methyltransferase [Streptomyces justiciae]
MSERHFDVWAAGDAYERYMGRWSRRVADEFVRWLDCPPEARWLDIGCGSGALTSTVAVRCRPRALLGVERSAGFAATARAAAPPPARVAVADAQALPVRDAVFDAAVSGLVLNFLPDPGVALAEAARVVRPGGVVAAYVWDYGEGMGFLRHFWAAATTVDASAAAHDEGRRFPLCRPSALQPLWAGAGLTEVTVVPVEIPTPFADFDDLWTPFLSGQGPAPGYVTALAPDVRERLRRTLRERVPTGADGTIELTARAWAVRGLKPGASEA